MAVCQSLTGAGGWPLTIVMTPDKRPFFAGTYFPKARRWGRPGLLELLPLIGETWRTEPAGDPPVGGGGRKPRSEGPADRGHGQERRQADGGDAR